MAEAVVPDKYVQIIPRFTLPAEFSNEKPETPPPPTEAPAAPPPEAKPPATEAAATPPEPETDPGKETTGKDPEKRSQRSVERRIDRLTKRAAEDRERAQALARELEALRQVKAPAPDEPRMDQFQDIEEYAKAREKWAVNRAIREQDKTRRQAIALQRTAELTKQWETRASIGASKYEDFDEIVGDLKPNSAWSVAMMQEENSEEIAYHLGKNIKEAQRIARLDPYAQVREIAKLSIKLATPEAPKKPSKAPPPITPVTEPGQPTNGEYRPGMSFEEYRKWGKKTFGGRR